MNRESFLQELAYLLSDVSGEEREEALQYYRDYFDEAGPERETELLIKLGSPEKVAAEVKSGLNPDTQAGEYSERGYMDERFDEYYHIPDQYTEIMMSDRAAGDQKRENRGCGRDRAENSRNSGNRKNGFLLLILFFMFGLPLAGSIISAGFSVIAGVFGALFGVLGGLIGLVVAGFAVTVALIAGGIAAVIAGCVNMFQPAMGIMAVGFGFLLLALAMLAALVTKWCCTTVVPGLFHFCMNAARKCVNAIGTVMRKIFCRGGVHR